MSTSRLALRGHMGKALPNGWYVSSSTTVAATLNTEIIDAARTENDEYWNGAHLRIGGVDRLVRGGAGASTSRTPTVFLDQALATAAVSGAAYELAKGWSLQQYDEAIDEALEDSWPYFYDAVDDISTVLVDQQVAYPLTASWRQIEQIELEIANSVPTRYRQLFPGTSYDIDSDAANLNLRLRFIPTGSYVGLKLRIFARAIPTLGSGDASTTVHPWSVLVPGALAALYRSGPNPSEGALSARWERRADTMAQLFERRLHRLAMLRRAVDTKVPVIQVG